MRGFAAGRRLALAGAALVAGASLDVIAAPTGDSNMPNRTSLPADETQQHLAVVVPAYQGDLDRAVASLERWPTNCSPLTVENVDLVLYYAEGEEDRSAVEEAAGSIASTAGRCFANLRIIYAHLEKEEDAYPKGPSVMFFKMFLDEDIRSQLSEYDALAIVEWDVLVATDRSFEELYHAAFRVNEEFWVKGSNLEGTNLHSSAEMSEMWRVLGHINGNAIYNNKDPAFVEYVEYTRARWEYKYPYDVALWLTISDFPYSWPLYQRYSSKFVITNLISYVGYEHVTHDTVSDAIAGQTLFIHGSRVDDGSGASIKSAAAAKKSKKAQAKTKRRERRWRRLADEQTEKPACHAACGSEESRSGLPDGTSTVCDPTCDDARFDGLLCGAGDYELFGGGCRLCYVCPRAARNAQQVLRSSGDAADKRDVIMCDTMEPPAPEAAVVGCGDQCADRKHTVCDDSCGSNRHGDFDCNWKGLGAKCRHCYDDLEAAHMADKVAKHHGGRVIMCSTMEPPQPKALAGAWPAETMTLVDPSKSSSKRKLKNANTTTPVEGLRRFFRWSDDGKLSKKQTSKWQAKPKWTRLTGLMAADDSSEEAEVEEDTASTCLESCETVDDSSMKYGRICDESCEDGYPYGDRGCNTSEGMYGAHCRSCYYYADEALVNDSHSDRAIMCGTKMPVDVYTTEPIDRDLPDSPENSPDSLEDSPDTPEDEPTDCDVDGCPYANDDATKGRQCDDSCESGDPYGTLGCNAASGAYGPNCRACFYDVVLALEKDTPEDRAIMCDTLKPVDIYAVPPVDGDSVDSRDMPDLPDSVDLTSPDLVDSPDDSSSDSPDSLMAVPLVESDSVDLPDDSSSDSPTPTPPVDGDSPDSMDSPDDSSSDSPTPTPPVDGDSPDSMDSPDDDDLCDSECPYTNSAITKGRVCDDSCESGDPYGALGCNAKSGAYGPNCRTCFYDVELALEKDTPEDRAIMCDTMKPVDIYTTTDRDLPPIPELDCEETCPYESGDGTTGRVCDASCQDGEPYGTYGCNTGDGDYGPDCRFCYFDEEKARKASSADGAAIMCDTLIPVDAYSSRRLTDTLDLSTFSAPKKTKMAKKSKSERMFEESASLPFEGDLTRGDLCAFVAGRADEVDGWAVTVRSIQKFAPGMRVAVAAEADAVAEYERALGRYPGVKVSVTATALTASLYADRYCGVDDTSLIMYLNRGSVFSRPFTSKDTHSTRGELLVVHGNARASYRDSQLAKHTAFLLGPSAPAPPSFTYGTDLWLPVAANVDLREKLMSVDAEEVQAAMGSLEDLDDLTAVPQVLAALQYSRQTKGIWFLDPQSWVSQHLFKEASIWDIPLVKPRFTCAISPTILRQRDDVDVAQALENSLDFFLRGGKCQNGQVGVELDARRA